MKAILAAAATAMLFASAAAHAATPFDGTYVGIQGGYAHQDFAQKPADKRADNTDEAVTGGIHVGYGTTFGGFYVGTEAEYNMSGGKATIFDTEESELVGIEMDKGFGLSARAGFVVEKNTLAYVRGGWQKYDTTLKGVGSKWLDGYSIGGGVEHFVAPGVSLRGEYVWSRFEKLGADESLTIRPETSVLRLGASWHF